jgi:hypothetical protein
MWEAVEVQSEKFTERDPEQLATIPFYNPLKSPVGAHVNKTTYNPLETWNFLGPKWHSHDGSMPFHRAQKSLDFRGPTPSQVMYLTASKALRTGQNQSEDYK